MIHPSLESIGGSETVCLAILRALITHDFDVELLSSSVGKVLLHTYWDEVFSHVRVNRMRTIRPKPFDAYFRYLLTWEEIRSNINERPDMVFLTQEMLPGLARLGDVTKVLYVHYPRFHGIEDRGESLFRRGFLLPLSRAIERQLREIDLLICNSEFTKSAIERLWGKYGIPEPTVVYPPTLGRFDSSHAFEERQDRVLSVGRFSPFKRHEILKALAYDFPDIAFLSVGSYSKAYQLYSHNLLEGSPPNFSIRFGVSQTELARQYETSKLYVHLAVDEHFGIAITEALSAGCVPLAHNSGGPKEILPKQLLWNDIEDLRQKLELFLGDRKTWTLWHEKCKQIASRYTFDTFSRSLMQTIRGGNN